MEIKLSIPRWNIEELCGYKPITTFWYDFSIAEGFGFGAVCDTYNRAFQEWKHDYKHLTELVMVLNWKIWQHCERNEPLAQLYNSLWEGTDNWAIHNLKGDELSYFIQTTD